jgi:hypothetical protein
VGISNLSIKSIILKVFKVGVIEGVTHAYALGRVEGNELPEEVHPLGVEVLIMLI